MDNSFQIEMADRKRINVSILHFTFLFSLFVFVSAAGHYFRIWTGQVPGLF